MLIGGIIALCLILLILAFLAPRLSRGPERGSEKALGLGGRGAGKAPRPLGRRLRQPVTPPHKAVSKSAAPGPLGRWVAKPFTSSQKAVSKSASTGRKGRSKMPF